MSKIIKINNFHITQMFAAAVMISLTVILAFGQTPDNTAKAAQADTIFTEAINLAKQGTAESMQAAIPKFEEAQILLREIGDKKEEIYCLGWLATMYSELGDKQRALDYNNQSLPLSKAIGDKQGEASTLSDIGLIYSQLGESQKALDYSNQSLPLSRAVGDKDAEAVTLNNIGLIYITLGDKQKALNYFNQALPLTKAADDKNLEATILINVGYIYSELGDKQKALDYYNQSLLLTRETGDKHTEIPILTNIGQVYSDLGENQKALSYYNQALPLSRIAGDKQGEAQTLLSIGLVYSDLDENQKALDYINQSLPLSRVLGDKKGEASILNNIMFVWNRLGNLKFAAFYGKQSVNVFQQLRSNITGLDKSAQQTYLKSIEGTYRSLAGILIADGRFSEAQQVLDLFKDQQFFDFNRNPKEPIKQIAQTPRESESAARYQQSNEQIGKVGSQLDELKRKIGTRQPSSDESAQLEKLESDLKIASDAFLAVLKQTETDFSKPADAKDQVGEISDTVEMQKSLRDLNRQTGQKTVAVYTVVGVNSFRALIVSTDGIKAVSSPIKGTELNAKALKLWGLLQSDKYDTTVLSKQIYDVVFAPIEKELPKDTTTIMWSLDGNLRYLPMAALWDGKRFLAERFNHVNFTRADSERLTRGVNPNWTGTGFGTTEAKTVELLGDQISFAALPGVKAELAQIFKQTDSKTGVLTGEVLPDAKFTKMSFLAALKQKRPLVHIASHFSFRPGDEARSFLLLGDGTALTLDEMKQETNLFAGVDLLTLSACNTAAAQADANGREIDGFAELAQRLGAGAVMATLWSVSDASTPWLMRDFYETRQSRTGMNKAEALRQAQIALLDGTAQTAPLPNGEKGAANDDRQNKPQIVIIPKGGKREDGDSQRGSNRVYLDEADVPLYKKDDKKPFAHPYYWSPFVLFGNWR